MKLHTVYTAPIALIVLMLLGCASQTYQTQEQSLIHQSVQALLQNDWDRAEAAASVALEINPENAQAAYMMALVHEHYGQIAEAKGMYRRIIKLNSDDTLPAGLVQHETGQPLARVARKKLGMSAATAAKIQKKPLVTVDSDGDGIMNTADRCAETPSGAKVDSSGCWTLQDLFKSGKSQIQPQALTKLDDVVALLKANPQMRIEIQGHTDSSGTYRHNLRLSRARAQAVVQYLRRKGIAAGRLTATGYGPNRPRGSNDTAEGRARNRRIEFRVLEK
jgi:outer membrane protein OmpA-like peptidoglycan-associated protein